MTEIGSLSVQIGLDGAQFSRSVKEINGQLRLLDSEFKAATIGVDKFSTNLEDLGNKQSFLNDKLALQKEKAEQLKREFQTLATSTNASAQQIQKAQTAYNNAIAVMAKTENQLEAVTKQLNTQSTVWGKLGQNLGSLGTKLTDVGGRMQTAGADIATSFGVATAAIGVGLTSSVKSAADFEAQLSSIKAVSGATGKEMSTLSAIAVEYGSKTKYSSLEAAQGIEELIKAGVSIQDIINGGLEGALSLATAGELELAEAAEIASTALNAFKDDGLNVARAADLLAGGANASATSVGELKFGLSQVSAVAAGLGLSFQDTTTSLALFANSGLKGSDAGTSLKTMLSNLIPKSDAAIGTMAELGIVTKDGANAFFDAQGNVKSMAEIAGILNNALKDLNAEQRQQALYTMFGSDAIRAANILYKEGATGINNMYKEMSKVTAVEVATERMNNFKGKMEELKGSVETAKISLGNALLPVISSVTIGIQKLVDGFNNLSPGMQKTIAIGLGVTTVVLGIVAAIGIILTVIGTAAVGIGQLAALFGTLSASIAAAGGAMAILTGPVGIAIGVIAALIAIGVLLYKNWDTIKEKTVAAWDYISKKARELWTPIKDFIVGIVDTIKTNLLQKWNVIKEDVSRIFEGLKTYFMGYWQVIKNIFLGALLIIVDLVTGDFEGMKKHVIQILGNIVSGVLQMWTGIQNIFKGFIVVVVRIFVDMWENLKQTVSNAWKNITESVMNIRKTIIETLQNIDLRQIGIDIMAGLISGIASKAAELWDKVKSIADGIKNSLKDALDINSPSKVMANDVGRWIPAGIAQGIEKNLAVIDKATRKMEKAAAPNVNNINNSKTFQPSITVYGGPSAQDIARMNERALRKLAFEWG